MKFSIDTPITERFPELEVHAVRVNGLRGATPKLNDEALLQEAIAILGQQEIDPEKVSEYSPIAAWREAYAKMNVKPSRFRSSIEALLRRALKDNNLVLPIPAVNFYNALSIMHVAPAGAYDVDKLPADSLEMRLANPAADTFEPLGSEASEFPLNDNLVTYATGDTVLCWGFNCRDSKAVGLDADTDNAIFFSEAAYKTQATRSHELINAIRTRLLAIGVSCSEHMLAKAGSPSFEI